MATSQFKIYTSEDPGGPGPVNGLSGSLLSVLNAVLVNGYAGHPAAGWIKPCADSASYGGFKQPSGSQYAFFLNDGYPGNTSYGEAWITGWTLVGPSGSHPGVTVPTQMVGASGSYGQFPLPAQLGSVGSYGSIGIKKSNTVSNSPRTWIIAADAYTVYMWIDIAVNGTYYSWGFGDIYAFLGTNDKGRCLIFGRYSQQTTGVTTDDSVASCPIQSGYGWGNNAMQVGQYGFFLSSNQFGLGGSQFVFRKGDAGGTAASIGAVSTNYTYNPTNGVFSYPNPYDGSMHLSPLWIGDPTTGGGLRGRMRGLYQPLHYNSSFSNGQTISGSGDYNGRSFMIVRDGYNGGMWALEVSNTLDTN